MQGSESGGGVFTPLFRAQIVFDVTMRLGWVVTVWAGRLDFRVSLQPSPAVRHVAFGER